MIRHEGVRIEYSYKYDNGKLVGRTIQHSRDGKTEINYAYKKERLIKIVNRNPFEESVTDFQYTDTLITTTSVSKEQSSVWLVNSTTSLDNTGRKKSLNIFMQKKGDPVELYQSEDYKYYPDGGIQITFTQHNPDMVSIREFHPWYLATEKWTWEGSDQVLVKMRRRL